MVFYLDLREDARRAHLLDSLFACMDPRQRDRFDAIIAHVAVPDRHHHNVIEVNETIDALSVPDRIKEDMHGVYGILAAAEAHVHGCEVSETHFHEVGNANDIRNALAICAGFYVLSPDEVVATPIQTGEGEIECAHGVLSIPAPATAAILEGLPLASPLLPGERCTPTSAALIRHFVTSYSE